MSLQQRYCWLGDTAYPFQRTKCIHLQGGSDLLHRHSHGVSKLTNRMVELPTLKPEMQSKEKHYATRGHSMQSSAVPTLPCKWIELRNMARSQNYNGIPFLVTDVSRKCIIPARLSRLSRLSASLTNYGSWEMEKCNFYKLSSRQRNGTNVPFCGIQFVCC